MVLFLIGWIPVCPRSWGVHLWQAPLLTAWMPGQWIQRLCNLKTNWHAEKWTIGHPTRVLKGVDGRLQFTPGTKVSSAEVIAALSRCDRITEQDSLIEHAALRTAHFVSKGSSDSINFSGWFFTPRKRWLDVLTIKLEDVDGETIAHAFSGSSSVVPASSPFAIVPALLLFWIPFDDFGQNKSHLLSLRIHLQTEGFDVEVASDNKST